jgi:hypothetical protein
MIVTNVIGNNLSLDEYLSRPGPRAGLSGVSACGFIEGQTVQESASAGVSAGLGLTFNGTTADLSVDE